MKNISTKLPPRQETPYKRLQRHKKHTKLRRDSELVKTFLTQLVQEIKFTERITIPLRRPKMEWTDCRCGSRRWSGQFPDKEYVEKVSQLGNNKDITQKQNTKTCTNRKKQKLTTQPKVLGVLHINSRANGPVALSALCCAVLRQLSALFSWSSF